MIVCVASPLYHFHSLYSLACAQPLTFVVCTTGALQTRQHTAMNIGMTKEGTDTSTWTTEPQFDPPQRSGCWWDLWMPKGRATGVWSTT